MGLLSNRIDRRRLSPGDHIYSWRQAYLYAHHGIYVGEGKVIHFTGAAQETGKRTVIGRLIASSPSSHPTDIPCPTCGGDETRTDGVISSCLDCFLSGGDLYLFEYGVSRVLFLANARGGTCTRASSDPAVEVLHRAMFLLQNGFGGYNVFKNNCEDFAIYCKTGLLVGTKISVRRGGQVGQAASFLAGASAAICSPLITASFSLLGGLSGLSVVGGGVYCASRYVSDIGVRRDATKVQVEKIAEMASES